MTKKKPGAVRGRPPIGDVALDEQIVVRVPRAVKERLEAEAAAQGVTYGAVARDVLERWAKRRAKGSVKE